MAGCAASGMSNRRQKHPLVSFEMLHLPVYSDADPARAEGAGSRRAHERVRGGRGRPRARRRRATRRSAACPAATASSATIATPPARSTRSSSSGPGRRYRYDYEQCTGCAVCFDSALPRHRDDRPSRRSASAHGQHGRTRAIDRDDGRQHGRRPRRLSRQRGLRDLSDHPVLDDGGARRRMVGARA